MCDDIYYLLSIYSGKMVLVEFSDCTVERKRKCFVTVSRKEVRVAVKYIIST